MSFDKWCKQHWPEIIALGGEPAQHLLRQAWEAAYSAGYDQGSIDERYIPEGRSR